MVTCDIVASHPETGLHSSELTSPGPPPDAPPVFHCVRVDDIGGRLSPDYEPVWYLAVILVVGHFGSQSVNQSNK